MGFGIPGVDELRFNIAPTGSGDVHVHVEPVAHVEDTRVPDSATLPPPTWLYPLRALPAAADLVHAATSEHLRPVNDAFFVQLAAASAARVSVPEYRESGLLHESSAPRTIVVPTLPPLDPCIVADQWGVAGSSHGSGGACHGEPFSAQAPALTTASNPFKQPHWVPLPRRCQPIISCQATCALEARDNRVQEEDAASVYGHTCRLRANSQGTS
jgi:hypothetical protein